MYVTFMFLLMGTPLSTGNPLENIVGCVLRVSVLMDHRCLPLLCLCVSVSYFESDMYLCGGLYALLPWTERFVSLST